MQVFSGCGKRGPLSTCCSCASHCSGFSCGAHALGTQASVVVAQGLRACGSQALDCGLRRCDAWAQLLHGMWNLPGPGVEPMYPALVGRFISTALPQKSQTS